eukprot:jgi/Chlat1/1529/Chrsp122S01802
MAGSASCSSSALLSALLSAFIASLLAASSSLLTAAADEGDQDNITQSLEIELIPRERPSTVRERCYQSLEGRAERFLEDGVTPVTFADCERSPPCVTLNFMHEGDDAKDYKHCAARPKPTEWPTWDPYEEDSMDHDDTLGGSPHPMALLAELIGNKTVIMVGDSIMFQGVAAPRYGTLFLFARVNYYNKDVLARFLDLADIAISFDIERFAVDMISLQSQLEQFVTTPGAGKIAVIRGMSAQHFPHSGAWNLSDPTHRSNCTCARMEPRMVETNHVATQDRILQEMVMRASSSSDRLLFLPLYDLTVQRHDMHLQACKRISGNQSDYAWTGCCDCTHYCYTPGLWDRLAARLLNLFWRGHCHMRSGDCTNATSTSSLAGEASRSHFQERQVLAHLHDRYG